jgi:hypothetical protein
MKALCATVVLLIALDALAVMTVAEDNNRTIKEFDVATVHFEQNATDGDVEAVFEAVGSDEGLAELSITAPDGQIVVDSKSPAQKSMGIREFHFESPEPTDVPAVKKAFPEGNYTFRATTASGERLESKATLSHSLPPTTALDVPAMDAKSVSAKNLIIKWRPVEGVQGYTLELSPSKSRSQIEVKLPSSITSFAVPDGILVAGGKCQIGIGTVSKAGNVSVIEATFEVSKK